MKTSVEYFRLTVGP